MLGAKKFRRWPRQDYLCLLGDTNNWARQPSWIPSSCTTLPHWLKHSRMDRHFISSPYFLFVISSTRTPPVRATPLWATSIQQWTSSSTKRRVTRPHTVTRDSTSTRRRDSASTRRRVTRPPPCGVTLASTQWSATRASPGDGGVQLGLHPAARDSASNRRRDLGLHPMKCNSGFTQRWRWQWREEPWRAQRHDDDVRMAATTTQRRKMTLLPLDGDGKRSGGPSFARGWWLEGIGPGSGPDRPRSRLGHFFIFRNWFFISW
jgi:hypothetical protein